MGVRWCLLGCLVLGAACGSDGDSGPADENAVAIAIAKLASCSTSSPVQFAGLSLPYMTSANIRCVADADDCASALACVGMRLASSCPPTPTCVDDNTKLECRGMIPFEIDCASSPASGGDLCLTTTDGRGKCATRTCTTEGETCDGSVRIDCAAGVEETFDCGVLGVTCSTVGDGTECTNVSAPTCDGPSFCDGNDAVHCEAGMELRTSCGGVVDGGQCFTDGNDVYCGYGAECDPSISDPDETCDGTKLRFCMLGKTVTVDCAAIGFSGCVSDQLSTGCR